MHVIIFQHEEKKIDQYACTHGQLFSSFHYSPLPDVSKAHSNAIDSTDGTYLKNIYPVFEPVTGTDLSSTQPDPRPALQDGLHQDRVPSLSLQEQLYQGRR